jgi:hypothetical protein
VHPEGFEFVTLVSEIFKSEGRGRTYYGEGREKKREGEGK